VRQLNGFIDLSESDPGLRQELTDCSTHQAVVALARSRGFEIGRRWGEKTPATPNPSNLLSQACPAAGEERSEVLLKLPSWRLERIHSCQACSPPDFWYDQAEHEWVVLLQGSAQIHFEGEVSTAIGSSTRTVSRSESASTPGMVSMLHISRSSWAAWNRLMLSAASFR